MTLQTKSGIPARFRNAVVVACDKDYVPYGMFLLNQILQLEQDREFDVCLVSPDDFWHLPPVASGQIRFIQILNLETVGSLPTSQCVSEAFYLRLFLPNILSDEYDRILYLDSDIFLNRAGLSKLFATDLAGHSLAAVRDIVQVLRGRKPMPEFEIMGLKDVAYLNSGVLLIDCKRFIETNLELRCMEFARQRPDIAAVHFGDQSALNCVLRGDWKELHPEWNWMYSRWTVSHVELESPYIIHFIGLDKPWLVGNGAIPQKYCDAYYEFLSIHFPDHAKKMPKYETARRANQRFRRYMLKSWYYYPKFRRYFDGLKKAPNA